MVISKLVKQDGTGDYTSISSAFDDMLVSGVAASGNIDEYFLRVDNSEYYDTISGYIPYSGTFNIIGSGTIWNITDTIDTSGEYFSPLIPNLYISNLTIVSSGVNDYTFSIQSGYGLGLGDVQIIEDISGIYNNGSLIIESVQAIASYTSVSRFISGSGLNVISNLEVAGYETGVYSSNATISNSVFHNNQVGVYSDDVYTLALDKILMYDNSIGLNVGSGYLNINSSTIIDPIYINNSIIQIDETIMYDSIGVSGDASPDSYIKNSRIYPEPTLHANIIETNVDYDDPKFNNFNNKDFRLQFDNISGSDCIEFVDEPVLSGVDIVANAVQFNFFDDRGNIDRNFVTEYIYTQGSSALLTDYNKEYKFADRIEKYVNPQYQFVPNISFTEYNVKAISSFSINEYTADPYPWDWDLKTFSTTRIDHDETYIIPRSIINIENIIYSKLNNMTGNVFYSSLSKDHIKVYDKEIFAGIAFDSALSSPSESITWLLNSSNQMLIKQNIFTGESLEQYPLLCPNTTKKYIKPSGIIYVGVDSDYYKFIKSSDPDVEIRGYSELGDCQWLPFNMNTKYDLRGIVSNKNYLYITGSEYYTNIVDRSVVPTGESIGRLLWYYNNDLSYNYMNMPNETNGPKMVSLSSGNYYPTDMTIYEDGSLLIADYRSASGIFKYNLAYDYALIQSSYDNDTRVILREFYSDVNL